VLEIGTLRRVELEADRVSRFMVCIDRRPIPLAHGTCFVTVGFYEVMGRYGWHEVLIVIASGEHAGRLAVYDDSHQHRMLSVRLSW
jgi:hypothetical protein